MTVQQVTGIPGGAYVMAKAMSPIASRPARKQRTQKNRNFLFVRE